MKNEKKDKGPFFNYKGKPLVRCGNIIYYGDINDKYVTKIEIKSTKNVNKLKVATAATVEMIDTNSEDVTSTKIVKISEKNGLYPALDIADIWLERAAGNQ